MIFDYSQYVRACLFLPLVISMFFLAVLVSCIMQFVVLFFEKNTRNLDISKLFLAVMICGFFLAINIGRLLHGGFHLIFEREQDAVEIRGEITSIEELGRFSFPEMKSDYGYGKTNGVQFTISGIPCSAPVQGGLNVGDPVTVVYLPQSGYILSISLLE